MSLATSPEFKKFMSYVGEAGYANPDAPITRPEDGSYDLVLQKDGFRYHDHWFGGEPFGGMEVVSKDGKAFWMMAYFGSLIDPKEQPKDVYGIALKEALREPAKELPVRGPKNLTTTNGYVYEFSWDGDIERLSGEEIIKNKQGSVVYRGQVSGGLVDL